MGGTPYRPLLWSTPAPQRIMITFPGSGSPLQYNSASGITAQLPTGQTNYVFDAVIVAGHSQKIRKTEHPVQSGANISDHAFILPAELVLDIGISDAMDAYYNPTTWVGNSSKSVAAYQTLLALQGARIPLTVTTRLRTYNNMLIEDLPAEETVKTFKALRGRVVFGQIFVSTIGQPTNSARMQDTSGTNLGSSTTQPPTPAQNSQNNVSGATPISGVFPSDAIGAGNWSSVNTDNLVGLAA
jgi:hypothetical protein